MRQPFRPIRVLLAFTATALVAAMTFVALRPEQAVHAAARPISVIVQPGDTLWTIAAKTTHDPDPRDAIDRIIAENGLESAQYIFPGQTLRIRP
jgi:nucleoid-associated protein YgaU